MNFPEVDLVRIVAVELDLECSMKRIAFMLVAVAAVAGVAIFTVAASGHGDGEAAPIFGVKIPADTATGD